MWWRLHGSMTSVLLMQELATKHSVEMADADKVAGVEACCDAGASEARGLCFVQGVGAPRSPLKRQGTRFIHVSQLTFTVATDNRLAGASDATKFKRPRRVRAMSRLKARWPTRWWWCTPA